MKYRVISDLHVEHLHGCGLHDLGFEDQGEDVVIAAGDIDNYRYAAMTLRGLFPDKPIVYVAGNHEFYGADYDDALAFLRHDCKNHDIIFLENDIVELNGQRILGTTLWAGNPPDLAAHFIADFNSIIRYRRLFNLEDCMELYFDAEKFLKMRRPGDIVVTHFMPHKKYTHPKWANHHLNAYFANTLDTKDVKLWVFGHTHSGIQADNVVCNPRGYNHEVNNFNPNLIVEV
jgi:predicted phosphodiesterase